MPRIIVGNPRYKKTWDSIIRKKSISYDYPDGLDLRPGSKLHDRLRDKIIERANEAHDAIYARRDHWKKVEQNLTSYIPLDEVEEKIKNKDSRKPVRVVVPVSFATIETLLTYFVMAFLRDPIFNYEGYSREDVLGAMLLEKTIQQQAINSSMGLALHTWWRDGFSAGFGAATPVWHRSNETIIVKKKMPGEGNVFSRAYSKYIKLEPQFIEEEVPAWEGNVLFNIDYRNYLPDPTVPVYQVHQGESAGWIRRSNFMTLFDEEFASNGEIFNVEYLKGEVAESVLFDNEGSTGRADQTGGINSGSGSYATKIVDTIYMYMKIIPSDEGLGDSDRPEVWLFALSGDKVITQAHKVKNSHNEIPIVVNAPDYDGHTLLPISRMEIIYGLQQSMDWLFDSHIANVRKAINDMLIVDPSLINMHDLSNPGPGKLIRLRRSVWGRGVKDAVMQLPVSDVTRGNIPDTSFILDIIQRVSAASDSVQGIIRKGSERRSAAEFNGTMGNALSRIEKTAKITYMQGMMPLQRMLAENTKQFMQGETYVRLNKEWAEILENNMKGSTFESAPGRYKAIVTPDSIAYNYDIIPHDGSVPGAGDPQTWTQIFQIAATSEAVQQRVDVYRVFKHLALISGAKNIEDFEKQPMQLQPVVQSNEEIQQQVQAGNYLPTNIGG